MRPALAAIIIGLSLPAVATAQDEPADIPPLAPRSADEATIVTITPYAWLAGVSGPAEVSPALPRPDIDSDSSGIFDNLDFFGFAVGEVSKGRWGASLDVAYIAMTFGDDLQLPPAFPLGGELSLDGAVTTVEGFYRFRPAEDVDLDVMGGVRLFWLDLGLEVHGPGGTTLLQGEAEDSWADVIVGVRGRWTPGRWAFTAQADIGGGDGTSSRGAVLMADYRLTRHFGVMGGYRWLEFDHDKGGRELDLTLAGPMIGARWTF